MPRNLLLALACSLAIAAAAQPTWRFHLAFEDGTGAKDTIWMVFDTTATIAFFGGTPDYDLGEGGVTLDPDSFHVWMINGDFDSTQTDAQPYSYFPEFYSQPFHGMNFQYPLTLRWDTSMFHAPELPEAGIGGAVLSGEYFWQAGYSEPDYGTMDMTIRDSIVLYNIGYPFFGSRLIFWDGSNTLGIARPATILLNTAISGTILTVSATVPIQEIALYNLQGGLIYSSLPNADHTTMDMGYLPSTMYLLGIKTKENQWYHEKLLYTAP